MSGGLDRLNALPGPEAEAALRQCCGSTAWARRMAEGRPYRDPADLFAVAERVWWDLGRDDWLEAFAAHPRIGEKPLRAGDEQARRWSEQEQAGAGGASSETLAALVEANRLYEERFGHLFIVCATGKSAGEMLELLRGRLGNDPDTELRTAAEEQRKITRLRLEKLLGP